VPNLQLNSLADKKFLPLTTTIVLEEKLDEEG
jgi:hypothetical protein